MTNPTPTPPTRTPDQTPVPPQALPVARSRDG